MLTIRSGTKLPDRLGEEIKEANIIKKTLNLIPAIMWTTMKSMIFISTIKVMLKCLVAAVKTPGAPMLKVIALVKSALFCKMLPQESEKITVCSHYPGCQQLFRPVN